MTTTPVPDAIDTILGLSPGASPDQLRRRRPATRENTEASYQALFATDQLDEMSLPERFAVAVFVAELHRNAPAAGFYADGLDRLGASGALRAATQQAAVSGATTGPYGAYNERGLQCENRSGLRWRAPESVTDVLGTRLTAGLEHAHLLVFRPRESSPAALERLAAAGWSITGIVTLSQLVAFLAYQLRVVSGLQLLAGHLQPETPTPSVAEDQTVRTGS